MVLEDGESNIPDPEAATVCASIDVGVDSVFKLNKPIDPSDHEASLDVEDDRFVDEDLYPPPEQESPASMLAQAQPYSRYNSLRPSHDRISEVYNRNKQCITDEPGPHTLPKQLEENGRGGCDENIPELEGDMLVAFEEQEMPSLITSHRSPHRQDEPPYPQVDQANNLDRSSHGRLKEARDELREHILLHEQDYKKEEQLLQ